MHWAEQLGCLSPRSITSLQHFNSPPRRWMIDRAQDNPNALRTISDHLPKVEGTEIHFSRINLPSSLSTKASLPGMHERITPIPHPTTSPRTNSKSNSCASNLLSSEMTQHIRPAPFPRNSCAIDVGLFSVVGMVLTNLASNHLGLG